MTAATATQIEDGTPAGGFRRRRLYRVVVAVLLTIVTVLLLGAALWTGLASARRRVGLVVRETAAGLEITSVAPSSPAARGGLLPRDVFVRVAHQPVANTADYNRLAASFHTRAPVAFVVRRGAELKLLSVVPGEPFGWRDFLISTLTVLCFLGVGLLAFVQRFDDLRARLLSLFCSAVAIELALPAGVIGFPSLTVPLLVAFYLLTGLQIGTELHLASVLPRRQPWLARWPWVVAVFYAAGAAVALGTNGALLAERAFSTRVLPWSFSQAELAVNNVLMPVWALLILVLLGIPAFGFPEPEERSQARLVLLGVLPWAGIVFWTSVASALGANTPSWLDSLWSPLLLCYPVTVFIAIYRYHLFDIEFLVRRSLIYGALTGTLLLVFYAVIGAGSAVLSEAVAGARVSVWVVATATLLLGLLFAPLHTVVQRLIDRMFFPERRSRHERLTALAHALPLQGTLPAMGRHLVVQLREIFAVNGVTLLLADPKSGVLAALASTRSATTRDPDLGSSFLLAADDPGVRLLRRSKRPLTAAQLTAKSASFGQRLGHFRAAVAVPLLTQGELVGVLLVGTKVPARQPAAEELDLLNLFAHNVAAVLANARLFESATYENLTGLLRREAILDQFERELERARRYGRPLAVGMADIDHFKAVNDTYGHLAGDTALATVAQAFASGLRSSDTVGRYGGDEFLFLLPETDLDGAVAVADKIRRLVERVRIDSGDRREFAVTVSIGLTSIAHLDDPFNPRAGALIARADEALYRAKQNGRNRVEPAAPAPAAESTG